MLLEGKRILLPWICSEILQQKDLPPVIVDGKPFFASSQIAGSVQNTMAGKPSLSLFVEGWVHIVDVLFVHPLLG